MILVTSIPQSTIRCDAQKRDIGAAYQAACINSWIEAGFEPLSVNSIDEPISVARVEQVRTNRDALGVTGRRLVFFSDLIGCAMKAAKGGPFAVTNADILFSVDLGQRVTKLAPGEFLFSRRIDIDNPTDRHGTPYRWGFDFFAVNFNSVIKIPPNGLAFGAPWWDYYFPLLALHQGCRLTQLQEPCAAFHLKHRELSFPDLWLTFGRTFMSGNERLTSLPPTYSTCYLSATRPRPVEALLMTKKRRSMATFRRLSEANRSFLDSFIAR